MLKKPTTNPFPSPHFINNYIFNHPVRLIPEHCIKAESQKSSATHDSINFADKDEIVRINQRQWLPNGLIERQYWDLNQKSDTTMVALV